MHLVFAGQYAPREVTKSLFLAGPSPRSAEVSDWRQEALRLLEALQFDGVVFLPIPENRFFGDNEDQTAWTYDDQIEWECAARQFADVVVFWVPRDIDRSRNDLGMPAFTTNVEFGEDLASGKLVYGRPATAEKCRYLDKRCALAGLPVHETLTETLEAAVQSLGPGALRKDGEAYVPLFIWKTPQFQSWYRDLRAAGNRLDDAKLLFHYRPRSGAVFCYALWASIWVVAEQRHKSNELVFARSDASAVVAYHRDPVTAELKVVLVKEFRSPVSNSLGFVYELPGGSSADEALGPQQNAQHELEEETGLVVNDHSRFRLVGARQVGATLSSHKVHLFALELAEAELAQLEKAQAGDKRFGADDSEQTAVVVVTSLKALLQLPVDYAVLGMVFEALQI